MSNKDKDKGGWIGWVLYGSLIFSVVVAYFATGGDFKEAIGEAFTWWGWLITGSIFGGAAIYAFAETGFSLTGCLGTAIL